MKRRHDTYMYPSNRVESGHVKEKDTKTKQTLHHVLQSNKKNDDTHVKTIHNPKNDTPPPPQKTPISINDKNTLRNISTSLTYYILMLMNQLPKIIKLPQFGTSTFYPCSHEKVLSYIGLVYCGFINIREHQYLSIS